MAVDKPGLTPAQRSQLNREAWALINANGWKSPAERIAAYDHERQRLYALAATEHDLPEVAPPAATSSAKLTRRLSSFPRRPIGRADDIPPGTRVRLKVRSAFGWRGTATMLLWGTAIKDGGTDEHNDTIDACRHEWAVLRDQTPNQEHAKPVRQYLEQMRLTPAGERKQAG